MQLQNANLRGRRYNYRCRVPVRLVGKVGRRELNRSLGTTDPYVARLRSAKLALLTRSLWDSLERDVSQAEIDRAIRNWLQANIANDELAINDHEFAEGHAARLGVPTERLAMEMLENEADGRIEKLAESYQNGTWKDDVAPVVRQLLEQSGVTVAPGSPEELRIYRRTAHAIMERHKTRLARITGDYAYNPISPTGPFPPVEEPPTPVETGKTVREAIDEFLAEKQRLKPMPYKTERKYLRSLDLFADWVGATTPLRTLARRTIGEFRSILVYCPPERGKTYPGKSLAEIVELTKANRGPGLRSATINGTLACVSALLDWCESSGLIDQNPARGVRVKNARDEIGYDPFTPDELCAIFKSPVYTGCLHANDSVNPGTHKPQNYWYWLPLIGLFTGARIREIAQLRSKDVRERDGIWCFEFTEDDDGPTTDKSIKTEAGVRFVPVHPELIRLGFVEFAKHRQTIGAKMLLPELPAPVMGNWGHKPGQWFGRLLARVVPEEKRRGRWLVFHSFRHTMKDAMRDAEIESRTQDRLIGHENGHIGEDYGKGSKAPQLFNAISKIKLPVDLSHLTPWTAPGA